MDRLQAIAFALGAGGFLSGTLAPGLAVVAAVAAVLGAARFSLVGQIAAFAVAAVICLGRVWPVALHHHLGRAPPLHTGAPTLAGRSAVVRRAVRAWGGRVRVGGAWSSPLAPLSASSILTARQPLDYPRE